MALPLPFPNFLSLHTKPLCISSKFSPCHTLQFLATRSMNLTNLDVSQNWTHILFVFLCMHILLSGLKTFMASQRTTFFVFLLDLTFCPLPFFLLNVFRAPTSRSRIFHCARRASTTLQAEESQGDKWTYQVSTCLLSVIDQWSHYVRRLLCGWLNLGSYNRASYSVSLSMLGFSSH